MHVIYTSLCRERVRTTKQVNPLNELNYSCKGTRVHPLFYTIILCVVVVVIDVLILLLLLRLFSLLLYEMRIPAFYDFLSNFLTDLGIGVYYLMESVVGYLGNLPTCASARLRIL